MKVQARSRKKIDACRLCVATMISNDCELSLCLTEPKHDVSREQSLADAFDQSSAVLENLLVADVSSPSAAIQRAERALQLSDALSRLLPAEREAIVLKNWENMSLAEIAKAMERTPPAAAGLLKRGLHKLREEFARNEDSQG